MLTISGNRVTTTSAAAETVRVDHGGDVDIKNCHPSHVDSTKYLETRGNWEASKAYA